MKTKYLLSISAIIVALLVVFAFKNKPQKTNGTESYAIMEVIISTPFMSINKKNLTFELSYNGNSEIESEKVKLTEVNSTIITKLESISAKGYHLVGTEELILNPNYGVKVETETPIVQKTYTFKKSE
jgi:hypothetical protein